MGFFLNFIDHIIHRARPHDHKNHSVVGGQTYRLRMWIRTKLWAQVLIGLLLGILVGALLGPDLDLIPRQLALTISDWLVLPGRLFMGLISISLVTLVFASIVQGVTSPKSGAQLAAIGSKLGFLIIFTTTLAAFVGIALARWLKPGSYIKAFQAEAKDSTLPKQEITLNSLPEFLTNMIPTNPLDAFAQADMMAVVILALLFGFACRQANPEKIKTFLSFLEGMLEIVMLMVRWAMMLTPYAVFGLMAKLVTEVGFSTLSGLSMYMLTVLIGLLFLLCVYLVLVATLGKYNPLEFLKTIAPVQLLAFSTSSSAAVMPLSIETATQKLKVPSNVADVVIPLGATVNMAGTALYQAVAIIFLAQMFGIDLSIGEQVALVMTLVLTSVGAPGTPGVSIAILATVATKFGIPISGMVLIIGVDRILDMCRTVVNVTGDLTAAVLLRHVGEPQKRFK
jgi:Na+/H+-dicarboxylate symporter